MRILIATPEAVPFVKTGGLADVAGALCGEFRKLKKEVRIFLPLYKKVREKKTKLRDTGITISVPVGDKVVLGRIFGDQVSTFFIECDEFFDRQELYGTPEGDYSDNAARFVFFSRGVLEACKVLNFRPDVIHCNDWQTSLVQLYLRTIYRADSFFKNTATLLTIHNLGYQGIFPASDMATANLGLELFTPEGIEFYGKINFLKAGIISADILTTVSDTYSKEILDKEYGFGLEGLLKTRVNDLFGVINGIDYEEWNPAKDEFLPACYGQSDMSGKMVCKRELVQSLFKGPWNKKTARIPLISVVGRFSEQKGLDLIMQSMPEIMSSDVKLVVLGKGDERYHKSFLELSKKYGDKVSVTIGFDEALAHRIYAGSDFLLMPSKYEPCGLGQLISLRYGCVPIARKTGGLTDTIRDYDPLVSSGTGFLFSDFTPSAMQDALKRAFCVYTDDGKMMKMIEDGMKMDFSWKKSALRYLDLYKAALKKERPQR